MIKNFLWILIDFTIPLAISMAQNLKMQKHLKKFKCLFLEIKTTSMFFRSKKEKTNKIRSWQNPWGMPLEQPIFNKVAGIYCKILSRFCQDLDQKRTSHRLFLRYSTQIFCYLTQSYYIIFEGNASLAVKLFQYFQLKPRTFSSNVIFKHFSSYPTCYGIH